MNVHANYATRSGRTKRTKWGAVHRHSFPGAKLYARINLQGKKGDEKRMALARAGFAPMPKVSKSMIEKIEATFKEKGWTIPSREVIVEAIKASWTTGRQMNMTLPANPAKPTEPMPA